MLPTNTIAYDEIYVTPLYSELFINGNVTRIHKYLKKSIELGKNNLILVTYEFYASLTPSAEIRLLLPLLPNVIDNY
jgi:hypothetical protein